MYNHYIPQSDGSYRRSSPPDQRRRPEPPKPKPEPQSPPECPPEPPKPARAQPMQPESMTITLSGDLEQLAAYIKLLPMDGRLRMTVTLEREVRA